MIPCDSCTTMSVCVSDDCETARMFEWLADNCSVTYTYRRPDGTSSCVVGPRGLHKAVAESMKMAGAKPKEE